MRDRAQCRWVSAREPPDPAVAHHDHTTPIRVRRDRDEASRVTGEQDTGVRGRRRVDVRTHDHIGDLRPWHLVTPSDEMLVDDGLDRSVRPSDEEDNVREVHRTSTPTWSGHGCGTGSMVGGVLGSFRSSIR